MRSVGRWSVLLLMACCGAVAQAQTALSASPSFVTFLNQSLATTSTGQTVKLTASAPMTITVLASSNPVFKLFSADCVNVQIAAGGTCTFSVQFAPAATGLAFGNANLTYVVNNASSSISIPLAGNGTMPTNPGVTPETGWWWDPNLNGIGFFIETNAASRSLFMASFTYDNSGGATWLVSTGAMTNSVYDGRWLNCTGSQSFLIAWQNTPTCVDAGPAQINFSDSQHGLWLRPNSTSVALTRFGTSPGAPQPGSALNGWWWNAAASGTGYGIQIQGDQLFMVAYTYSQQTPSQPVWYLAVGTMTTPVSFSGTWQQFGFGPPLDSPECASCPGAQTVNANVAPMTLTFAGPTTAKLTVGTQTIPITSFHFNSSNVLVLNTAIAGSGSGSVAVSPAGESCGPNCYTYASGTAVTLTATASGQSSFSGWGGACSGTGPCTFVMDSSRTAVANFVGAGGVAEDSGAVKN